jgi:hypothetical protein
LEEFWLQHLIDKGSVAYAEDSRNFNAAVQAARAVSRDLIRLHLKVSELLGAS